MKYYRRHNQRVDANVRRNKALLHRQHLPNTLSRSELGELVAQMID